METDFTQSIVLITSQYLNNRGSGTGFVIHRDGQGTYLVTCAHVVESVGGAAQVSVYGQPAEVLACGDRTLLDLAVLRVAGLFERPLLPLALAATTGDAFVLAGYQIFSNNYLIRPLQGRLGAECGLELPQQGEHITAWDLTVDDPNFDIQPGYSGSPVIHHTRGSVLGVVSYKMHIEKKGLAISIAALKTLWPDMPANLFAPTPEPIAPASAKPSAFAALKRKTLEENLADLCTRYEAAHAQIRSTLSDVDKITIHNRIRQLEQNIRDTEQELNSL